MHALRFLDPTQRSSKPNHKWDGWAAVNHSWPPSDKLPIWTSADFSLWKFVHLLVQRRLPYYRLVPIVLLFHANTSWKDAASVDALVGIRRSNDVIKPRSREHRNFLRRRPAMSECSLVASPNCKGRHLCISHAQSHLRQNLLHFESVG